MTAEAFPVEVAQVCNLRSSEPQLAELRHDSGAHRAPPQQRAANCNPVKRTYRRRAE
jgi:hypothetical protein